MYGVHPFEEGSGEDVAFIENKADFFLFDATALHHLPQILVKLLKSIVPAGLDLEHAQIIHPGDEASECCFSYSAGPNQEEMAQRL